MLNESRRYEAECAGKVAFASKPAAKAAQRWAKARGRQSLHVYRCSWCSSWHHGHANQAKWLTGASA